MRAEGAYERLLERMMELAFDSSRDVARLVFTPEEADLDRLDLGQVAELKRLSNGTVEVQLLDRLKLMELLANLLGPRQEEQDRDFWAQLLGGDPSPTPPEPERG